MATFLRLCHRCFRRHICQDAIVDCVCPDCGGDSIETVLVRVER